jgi:P-type Mg2+ transporter
VLATLVIVVVTLFLPISPLAGLLEFQPLPLSFLLVLGAILLIYIIAAELLKKAFCARVRL